MTFGKIICRFLSSEADPESKPDVEIAHKFNRKMIISHRRLPKKFTFRISSIIAALAVILGLLLFSLVMIIPARVDSSDILKVTDSDLFQSVDSINHPFFTELTGANIPLFGVSAVSYWYADSIPAFGDIDGDGDLNEVIGEEDGVINYDRNTGTPAQNHPLMTDSLFIPSDFRTTVSSPH
jgi:hypothetical protein